MPPAYGLLEHLVTVPAAERRDAVAALVPGVRLQPCRNRRRRGMNLIVGSERPSVVIGAHHDLDPGTVQGATDNTAAVAVLVALAQRLTRTGFPQQLALCFWDLEEPGNGGGADGSRAYARALRTAEVRPDLAIVCDVFGLGVPWLSRRSDRVAAHLLRRAVRLQAQPAGHDPAGPALVRDVPTPPSDDAGLAMAGIPSALLTSLPASGDRSGWAAMHTPADDLALVDPASLVACAAALDAVVAVYTRPGIDYATLARDAEAPDAMRAPSRGPPRSSHARRRAHVAPSDGDELDATAGNPELDLGLPRPTAPRPHRRAR